MKHNPIKILTAFMEAWKENDFETMYNHLQQSWKVNHDFEDFVKRFDSLEILDFKLVSKPSFLNRSICDVDVVVSSFLSNKKHSIRLIHEIKPYKTSKSYGFLWIRGSWGINPQTLMGLFLPEKTKKNNFFRILKKQGHTGTHGTHTKLNN